MFEFIRRARPRSAPAPQNNKSRWADTASYLPSWQLRAQAASRFFARYKAVCDIGSGPHFILKQALPSGVDYYPADLVAWTPDTEACDLNAGRFPDRSLANADVCALLGVVERLVDPGDAFTRLAQNSRALVFSYHPKELRERAGESWVNHMSGAELNRLVEAAGLRIVDRQQFGDVQMLYHARRGG